MSILSSFYAEGKHDFVHDIYNFFNDFVPASLLRRCGITKPADLIYPDANYTQLSFGRETIFPGMEGVAGNNALGKNEQPKLIGVPTQGNGTVSIITMDDVKKNPALWYDASSILVDKVVLGFTDSTFNEIYQHGNENPYGPKVSYGKDTWYRFDRMHANWEGVLLHTGKNAVDFIQQNTETHGSHGFLCIDDSLLRRTFGIHGGRSNSRATEFLATQFDHNLRKSFPGFRMLTAFWTNGESGIPLCQSLLSSRTEKCMLGPFEHVDGRTWEGKRRERALTKGTEVMIDMTKDIMKAGVQFDYVLADTWFSCPAQLTGIKSLGKDMIAMARKRGNVKYGWLKKDLGGKEVTEADLEWHSAAEIYSLSKKRRGTSRYLLCVDTWVKDGDGLCPVRLVFNRNRSNRKEWVVMVTTDMALAPENVISYYCYRWAIERYFRIEKGYLRLSDCHSTSYDALTCRMVISALRYMVLVIARFNSSDNRTIEQIFQQTKREVAIFFTDGVMAQVFNVIFECIKAHFSPSKEQMAEFIMDLFDKLPTHFQTILGIVTA